MAIFTAVILVIVVLAAIGIFLAFVVPFIQETLRQWSEPFPYVTHSTYPVFDTEEEEGVEARMNRRGFRSPVHVLARGVKRGGRS